MAQYSSYYTYQKYVKYGNQDAVPVYPAEYSISGDSENTMPLVIKLSADTECGYVPPTDYQYRTVQSGYTCVGYDQYTRMVRQRSADGIYWENIAVSAGTLIMENSTYCGYIGFFKRWVESGTTCYEGDKYIQLVEQISYDSRNWTNTGNIDRGELIEMDSEDCIKYRWTATTGYVCSGTNKMTKEVYQVSYDGGSTWENVVPEESRAALPIIESASTDCGYVPSYDGKLKATYSDSTVYEIPCNSSTTLTSGETRGHSTSYTAMTNANVGNCVAVVGDYAFYHCSGLTSVIISSAVTSIGYASFSHCRSLTVANMPNTVETIGDWAFSDCSGLTSVVIPDSVTSIGKSSFRRCSGMTNLSIANSVTSVGENAFNMCISLRNLDVPSGVTSIDYMAFYGCQGLTSATISNTVTSIGEGAFAMCERLTSITINATTPPTLANSAFDGTNNCPIYVPSASVNAYKSASGWSSYSSRIQAIP